SGMALLEGLIAIVVFSIGILTLISVQAVAVRQAGEAGYRSEASLLASEVIGLMWVSDPARLQADFTTDGQHYAAWKRRVAEILPGVDVHPPTVDIGDAGQATVTVFWQAPGAPESGWPHRYVAI